MQSFYLYNRDSSWKHKHGNTVKCSFKLALCLLYVGRFQTYNIIETQQKIAASVYVSISLHKFTPESIYTRKIGINIYTFLSFQCEIFHYYDIYQIYTKEITICCLCMSPAMNMFYIKFLLYMYPKWSRAIFVKLQKPIDGVLSF